nr:immunoglobulin light chain junction region [Macaca mulatta]
CLQYKNNPRTF